MLPKTRKDLTRFTKQATWSRGVHGAIKTDRFASRQKRITECIYKTVFLRRRAADKGWKRHVWSPLRRPATPGGAWGFTSTMESETLAIRPWLVWASIVRSRLPHVVCGVSIIQSPRRSSGLAAKTYSINSLHRPRWTVVKSIDTAPVSDKPTR